MYNRIAIQELVLGEKSTCVHIFKLFQRMTVVFGARADHARRRTQLFKGEGDRKRVGLPMIGDVK